MGIQDRQYLSDEYERRGINMGGPRMMVTNLVLINVAIYVVDYLTAQRIAVAPGRSMLTSTIGEYFMLHGDILSAPWTIWQFLSYGFLHDLNGISHLLFNMLGLWMLGREVELKYGRKLFLQFYLSTIVLSGLGWLLCEMASQVTITPFGTVLGASGGVLGVITLYIFSFPKRTIYLWAVLPVPAWVLGVMIGLGTIFATNDPAHPVAHSAHVAGIGCGLLFFYKGWQLGRLIPERFSLSALRRKPKFRIHDPDAKAKQADEKMSTEVDQILEKISREGEASITARERRKLQDASRKYQKRDP